MTTSETVILCEGYHDRAFWKGWLESLGCTGPKGPPTFNPQDKKVARGQFAFLSRSQQFLRLVPCEGVDQVLKALRTYLKLRVRRVIVTRDLDDDASAPAPGARLQAIHDSVGAIVRQEATAVSRNTSGDLELDPDGTLVSTVVWHVADPPAPGLPAKQTLERLACAALCHVYPERAGAVDGWLSSRMNAPSAGPKEHAWSHMAGWYAARGCEAFYSGLWKDEAVRSRLEELLRTTGAWRIAEEIAR